MPSASNSSARMSGTLLALIALQFIAVAFFVGDVLFDLSHFRNSGGSWSHLALEALVTLSLAAAIVFEIRILLDMAQRRARLEDSLRLARGAVQDVIEAQFDEWALSPAERDVATFLVKGLKTAEIAELRGNAEGTVKAHLNAIYRKSGTASRGEMLSLLIDTMMGEDVDAKAA